MILLWFLCSVLMKKLSDEAFFFFFFVCLSRKYTEIRSQEQRQSYKNDFNAEYSEYRALHARIEGITRQFTVLDTELKQLQQGTDQYKVSALPVHNHYSDQFNTFHNNIFGGVALTVQILTLQHIS